MEMVSLINGVKFFQLHVMASRLNETNIHAHQARLTAINLRNLLIEFTVFLQSNWWAFQLCVRVLWFRVCLVNHVFVLKLHLISFNRSTFLNVSET